jgi:hypothetical protein
MAWYWWALVGVYGFGFVLALWFNMYLGMITLPLCILRALLWPIWLTTNWLDGEPL